MKKDHVKELRGDLKQFHEMTRKFYRGELTVPEYKSISGGFGSYAQRGGQRSMLRLRLTGGEIRKEELRFIIDSIQKYQIDRRRSVSSNSRLIGLSFLMALENGTYTISSLRMPIITLR